MLSSFCEWIREAWARISPTLIEKSFKKCSIAYKFDGMEDDCLWDNDANHASPVDDNESSREEFL
jgi:hypothetical protein